MLFILTNIVFFSQIESAKNGCNGFLSDSFELCRYIIPADTETWNTDFFLLY